MVWVIKIKSLLEAFTASVGGGANRFCTPKSLTTRPLYTAYLAGGLFPVKMPTSVTSTSLHKPQMQK